jgi:hypothetical protein
MKVSAHLNARQQTTHRQMKINHLWQQDLHLLLLQPLVFLLGFDQGVFETGSTALIVGLHSRGIREKHLLNINVL